MDVILGTDPTVEVREAIGRIESWVLQSGVQIDEGPHRGAIAGWLDRDGKPDFAYLEIAGYYLTAMAWLSAGAASSPHRVVVARQRARRAAGWIVSLLASHETPPTRLYLSEQRSDWRNAGLFTFDLAMAARGVAVTPHAAGRPERRQALAALCSMIDRISSGADVMSSHETVAGPASVVPDRWSTRPGPHHVKSAAAVLQLPERTVGESLTAVAHRTVDHWTSALSDGVWPCQELHALLYGLEGMLIRAGPSDRAGLRVLERIFVRLMDVQAPDGTLPETFDGDIVRSDVLAQALRVGMLLRGRQHLGGAVWTDRLDRLTDALLEFVGPDGGVMFSRDAPVANTWCAMFAHQALYLRAHVGMQVRWPDHASELLV